jgi:hypothetical protein
VISFGIKKRDGGVHVRQLDAANVRALHCELGDEVRVKVDAA